MKISQFASLLWLGVACFLITSACESNEANLSDPMTEEEAIEIIEGALMTETEGLSQEVVDAAEIATEVIENTSSVFSNCGQPQDSSVVRNFSNGLVTANYSTNWNWLVICNSVKVPTQVQFERSAKGNYETARLSSNDSATSKWTVTNLLRNEALLLNGSYERIGSQDSKVRLQRGFDSVLKFTVKDLTVNQNTGSITGGTANFTITGETNTSNEFDLAGAIVFNGSQTATVTLNGNTYTVRW